MLQLIQKKTVEAEDERKSKETLLAAIHYHADRKVLGLQRRHSMRRVSVSVRGCCVCVCVCVVLGVCACVCVCLRGCCARVRVR